mmetsp:Transcript_42047/g.116105  ORF Transcript_42047/g.116105 Transcript_42047/m.116105 type:complete len:222 (+) Transcript_42047:791-1456(+)
MIPRRTNTIPIARSAMKMPRTMTINSGNSCNTRANRSVRRSLNVLKTRMNLRFPGVTLMFVSARTPVTIQVSKTTNMTNTTSSRNAVSFMTCHLALMAKKRIRISITKNTQKACATTWKSTGASKRTSPGMQSTSTAIHTELNTTTSNETTSKTWLLTTHWHTPVVWKCAVPSHASSVRCSWIRTFNCSASAKTRPPIGDLCITLIMKELDGDSPPKTPWP